MQNENSCGFFFQLEIATMWVFFLVEMMCRKFNHFVYVFCFQFIWMEWIHLVLFGICADLIIRMLDTELKFFFEKNVNFSKLRKNEYIYIHFDVNFINYFWFYKLNLNYITSTFHSSHFIDFHQHLWFFYDINFSVLNI